MWFDIKDNGGPWNASLFKYIYRDEQGSKDKKSMNDLDVSAKPKLEQDDKENML